MKIVEKYKEYKFNNWSDTFKNKTPHYYKLFCKFFSQGIPLKKLIELYDFIQDNKHYVYVLPKNLIIYNSFYELSKDIHLIDDFSSFYDSVLENKDFPRKVWNSLSKDDKKKIFYLKKSLPRSFKEYNTFTKFIDDNDIKYSYYNNDKLYKYTKKLLSGKNTKIKYDKDGMLVATVDYEAFKKVTSKKWCIKKKGEWKKYVSKKKKQYVVIDFNYFNTYSYHKIAFTVNKYNEIKYVFNMDNDELYKKVGKKILKLINK